MSAEGTGQDDAVERTAWELFHLECSHEWRTKGEPNPVQRNRCGDCVRGAIAAHTHAAVEKLKDQLHRARGANIEWQEMQAGISSRDAEIERLKQETQAAVEREREQCAREVEGYEGYPNVSHAKVAAAIRQRASGEGKATYCHHCDNWAIGAHPHSQRARGRDE